MKALRHPGAVSAGRRCGVLLLAVALATIGLTIAPPRALAGTWEAQATPAAVLRGVDFPVDTSFGVAVGDAGRVLTTADGGENWVLRATPTAANLHAVHFPSATVGYAVGASGVVLKTVDGGSSWALAASPGGSDLHDVYFIDSSSGFAVDDSGNVWHTTDGGTSWVSRHTTGTSLRALHFPSTLVGFAVGLGPTLIKTTDGGLTWAPLFHPAIQDFYGVSFADDLTGTVVGGNGHVSRTSDGGSSWIGLSPPVTPHWRDVEMPTASTIYIVAANGAIVASTDGGASWGDETPGGTGLFGVDFPTNAHEGWAVGVSQILHRSGPVGSDSCVTIAEAGFFDELTEVDTLDSDPATNETDIGSVGTLAIRSVATAPTTGLLYAVDYDQLGTVGRLDAGWTPKPGTLGSGNGSLGPMPFENVDGLAFDTSGVLYGVAVRLGPDLVFKIDTTTGAAISDGFGLGVDYIAFDDAAVPGSDLTEISIDPDSGEMYGVAVTGDGSSTLVTVDLATETLKVEGVTPNNVTGFAFDFAGIAWALTSGGDLYQIDPSTALGSLVTSLDNHVQYHTVDCGPTKTGNGPPVWDPVSDQSVAENAPFSYVVSATDPDGDPLTLSAAGLPGWATFTDNGDNTATFTGTPGYSDAGTSSVTLTATDGTDPVNTSFDLTVTNTNRAPAWDPVTDQSVAENDPFTYTVSATDPDTEPLTLTGAGLPAWATFTDNGNNTATIAGTPGYSDAGTSTITLTATDGTDPANTSFDLAVTNTNRPPAWDPVIDQSTPELSPFSYTVSATDADGDPLTLSTSKLPGWATFVDNGDNTATISGTPDELDAGTSTITLTATDGTDPVNTSFDLTVTNTNRAPVWDPVSDQTVAENSPFTYGVSASDPDAEPLTLSASGLPAWATFIDNGDGTATIAGTPGYSDAATSTVTLTATDGTDPVNTSFDLVVTNTNRAPTFNQDLLDRTDAEGTVVSLSAAATDPDNEALTYSATGLPPGLAIDPATGLIGGTIDFTAAESSPYAVTITVTDDTDPATDVFTWTVTNTNGPPVWDPVLDQSTPENTPFTYTVSATDPDTEPLTLTATGVPAWATFTDNGNNTATISGTPGFTDAGVSTITLTATDGIDPTVTTFNLTVTNTNRPPVWDPVADQSVAENDPFTYGVSATDADGEPLTLSAAGLPAWATFTDNGNGTATISGTPGFSDAGTSTITLTATDGTNPVNTSFDLVVTNTNRPPVWDPVTDQSVAENAPFTYTVSANDPDGQPLTLTGAGLPAWATFTDNGNGTATISGTPGFTDAATSTVTLTATDPTDTTTTTTFDLTVTNTTTTPANDPPIIAPVSDVVVTEGSLVTVALSAFDPDGGPTALAYSLLAAPAGAEIDASSGVFSWTTAETHGPGEHSIGIRVSDGAGSSDAWFIITVTEEASAPSITPVPDQETDELARLSLFIEGVDPDVPDVLQYELFGDVPDGAVLDPDTGELTWTPSEAQGPATYVLNVRVTDSAGNSVQTEIVVTVLEINEAPVALPILRQVTEGATVSITLVASDADEPEQPLVFSLGQNAPTGATIDQDTGVFTWDTDETDGPRTHTFEITVSDGITATAVPVEIVVLEINDPPRAAPVKDLGVNEEEEVKLRLFVVDRDVPTQELRFVAVAGFELGGQVDPITGVFTWTPPLDTPVGAYRFVVEVSDGLAATQVEFIVRVGAPAAAERKAGLLAALAGVTIENELPELRSENTAQSIIRRTFVTMAGAVSTTGTALRFPFVGLLVFGLMVATFGRIGLVPLFRRSKKGIGVVRTFDLEAGFGYIDPVDGSDRVMVHSRAVRAPDVDHVKPGEYVTYRVVQGRFHQLVRRVRPAAPPEVAT